MLVLIAALNLLAPEARAQACVCSRNVALPSGHISRPGEVTLGLDYGMSLSGDGEGWQGLSVTDLHGDSMAGMFMPPHVVQTLSLTAGVGLPRGFSASATLPTMLIDHLGVSEMPGDVDSRALADADLTGRWSRTDQQKKRFYGASLGLTLPTGKVVTDSPVRSGRGTLGASAGIQGGLKLSPKTALVGSLSGSTGFGADAGGYRLGPSAAAIAGVRGSLRENGRLSLGGYGLLRWQDKDRKEALVYENTGFLTADLALGLGWTVWENKLRSAALSARVQAPVWQVVGDPMYAENVSATLAVNAVVF